MSKSSVSSTWSTCYSQGEIQAIEVQVLIRSGLPRLDIIGLPENMIREGKDRILSALSHLGVDLATHRVLVSLNPGNLPKEGSHFDLPILVGILTALGMLLPKTEKCFYWGELGLDGSIRQVDDILAHLLFANNFRPIGMASAGRREPLEFIYPHLHATPRTIRHVANLVDERSPTSPSAMASSIPLDDTRIIDQWREENLDRSRWNHLRGSSDQFLFWSLAVLGRHHILLEGSQGVGKSSWCYAAPELQPPLIANQWHDRFRYQPNLSQGMVELADLFRAPFEAPHHGSSTPAIVGGGSGSVNVGSLTRSHTGILFLDEFSEFGIQVLESLREPLENKTITIARSGVIQTLSADIQLLAAMNPCKCGYYGSNTLCTCTTNQFYRHKTKVSGPLRSRFHAICWWTYVSDQRPKEFDLRNVRARLIEALKAPPPKLGDIDLPSFENPRKEKKWLEFFISWCRWFQISIATQSDCDLFNQFLEKMEEFPDDKSILSNVFESRKGA